MQRERKEEERETMTSDYRKFLLDLISSTSHFNKNEAAASATSLSKQKYLSKFQNFSSKNSSFGSFSEPILVATFAFYGLDGEHSP